MRASLLLGILLLAAPAAAEIGIENPGDAAPTPLYVHFIDAGDGYLSVLPAPGDADIRTISGAMSNSGCADLPPGTTTFGEQSYHTFYAVVAADTVPYREGNVAAHVPVGPTTDLRFDGSDAHLTWFLEVAADQAMADPNVPAIVPEVVVRATVRMGDSLSVANAAYNSGQLVARAETEATLLAREQTDSATIQYDPVEGRDVYRVDLVLPIGVDTIPEEEGFNLRLDTFIRNGVCDDPQSSGGGDYVMVDAVRWYMDDERHPMLEMPVVNRLEIERFQGVFDGDAVVFKADFALAWGNADLEAMQFLLPTGAQEANRSCQDLACIIPGKASLRWNLTDVPDGDHDVRFQVTTTDGRNASAEARFELGADGRTLCTRPAGAPEDACLTQAFEQRSPGLAPLLPLVLAVILRRRDQ